MQLGNKNVARIYGSSNAMLIVSVPHIFNITLLYVNITSYDNMKFSLKNSVPKYNADDIAALSVIL